MFSSILELRHWPGLWSYASLDWRRITFQAHWDYWQNSVSRMCRTEGSSSCWLSVRCCPSSRTAHSSLPKMATWFFKSSKGERVSRMKDAIILCSKSCTSIPMHPLILALLCWLETRHKWCPYSRWGDETRTCTSEGENHGCYPRVYLPHSLKQEGSLLR